eukprot:9363448-Pyramimonas_sp.AAC.1
MKAKCPAIFPTCRPEACPRASKPWIPRRSLHARRLLGLTAPRSPSKTQPSCSDTEAGRSGS